MELRSGFPWSLWNSSTGTRIDERPGGNSAQNSRTPRFSGQESSISAILKGVATSAEARRRLRPSSHRRRSVGIAIGSPPLEIGFVEVAVLLAWHVRRNIILGRQAAASHLRLTAWRIASAYCLIMSAKPGCPCRTSRLFAPSSCLRASSLSSVAMARASASASPTG